MQNQTVTYKNNVPISEIYLYKGSIQSILLFGFELMTVQLQLDKVIPNLTKLILILFYV